MTRTRFTGVVGALVAGSMLVASTGAAATGLPASQPISPWATLAGLTGGAPAIALCGGAAVTAAQAPAPGCVLPVVDTPPPIAQNPPPPPVPVTPIAGPAAGFGVDPLLLGLAAVAAGVGIYFLVKHSNSSNSPA
jgi:hypothetical protein